MQLITGPCMLDSSRPILPHEDFFSSFFIIIIIISSSSSSIN